MLYSLGSNSAASSAGFRPARTSSTSLRRSSGEYGGWFLDIMDPPSIRSVRVSTEPRQLQGHWIVEGVEGRVHVVPEPPWLADWRAQKLDPGDVVSLWGVVVGAAQGRRRTLRSEEHTSELQSRGHL